MCFTNDDCDWSAEVYEETHGRRELPGKCCDCRRVINAGEWARSIWMCEKECCQICEDRESDWFEDPEEIEPDDGMYGPGEHPHYYGEHWTGVVCRECCLLREAIYDLEEKEDCPEWARQPAFGELSEVMSEDTAPWGDRKYAEHATRMFPSLAWHRLIRRRSLVLAEAP